MIKEIPLPDFEITEGAGEEIARIIRLPNGDTAYCVSTNNVPSPDPGYWGIIARDFLTHCSIALDGKVQEASGRFLSREELLARMFEIFDKVRKTEPTEVVPIQTRQGPLQ